VPVVQHVGQPLLDHGNDLVRSGKRQGALDTSGNVGGGANLDAKGFG
jgi:hypothetical protein